MGARPSKRKNGHIPSDQSRPDQSANGKKLSLWPLSVEEAAEAFLQVPPMPKDDKTAEDTEKAPPKRRRARK